MVSLRIVEIKESPNLSKLKGIAIAVLIGCGLLFSSRGGAGGNSIIENINDDLLYIAVAILTLVSAVTALICFIIEQTTRQVQIGQAVFNETMVQQIFKNGGLYSPYTDISKIYIRQEYSTNHANLFVVELYSTDNPGYCHIDFICEVSSWGTIRYLADYLRQQGVNCELSEQNVQAEVTAAKVGRWL
jgi:hypothetical protein